MRSFRFQPAGNNLIVWNSNQRYRDSREYVNRRETPSVVATALPAACTSSASCAAATAPGVPRRPPASPVCTASTSSTLTVDRQPYHREEGPPDPRCLSYTHDRDFGGYLDYPPGKEEFVGRGWCPPHHACYDSMERVFASKDEL